MGVLILNVQHINRSISISFQFLDLAKYKINNWCHYSSLLVRDAYLIGSKNIKVWIQRIYMNNNNFSYK